MPGRGLRKLSGTSAGLDVAQLAEQLEALLDGLAHAEQHAAAQLHAVLADELAGVEALVPGVGGDDLREERAGRLEVVVVAVDAALGEAPGLLAR